MPATKKRRLGRPTREEAVVLSEAILRVAQEHFVSRGYDGTLIEQIALVVGTTKGAIYNRFGSKAGLLAVVGEELLKRHYQPLRLDVDTKLSIYDSLRDHALRLIKAGTAPETLSHYRLFLAAARSHPEIPLLIAKYAGFYMEENLRFFQALVGKGALSLQNLERGASIFTSMILGQITFALSQGGEVPSWSETERYVTQITLVFIGGIGRLELEAGPDSV